MSDWVLRVHPKAQKELAKLDPVTRQRVSRKIDRIADNPHDGDRLRGSTDRWKYRVGDHRIIAVIEERVVTVTIVRIGSRGQVYRDDA